eukprot:CAMPEP_0119002804 /NCGR_PEP_ID=MMETSP1176-20130426/134_1 /TAXON_ID=265551 /ORGANISM="Synedropsis recta cf, Strain CCMP1620" /LENGTH=419 /DNA_ID=CAMNT_0006954329 /DNA_START=460 /DNA_END=1719 /DNA_ORIENTATION=-
MKFTLALSFFAGVAAAANPFVAKTSNNAKASFASKLVSGARRLNDADEEYEVDISGYSVKFEKCQFIKAYDDEMAEDEDAGTVLATKRFVIFKLCPNNSCSTCTYNYGEYMVDLDTYLAATVEYQQELQQDMCDACDECGNDEEEEEADEEEDADEDEDEDRKRKRRNLAVDCDSCYDECQKIENMEDNGYIDATEFLECAMIYDPEDDAKDALYAGPMCASSGTKIKIGVFSDEYCSVVDSSKNVDDYLVDGDGYQMKLSHALLKTVYSETCISCLVVQEEDEDANDDGNNDAEEEEPEVNELCQALYEDSAKCEKSHGFDNGYAAYDNYANQEAQEEVVCDFINSIEGGTYDDEGEISLYGANSSANGGSSTTGGQKFALTFFILGTVALAVYAAMLHNKLTKGGKAGLSSQGGAMA